MGFWGAKQGLSDYPRLRRVEPGLRWTKRQDVEDSISDA